MSKRIMNEVIYLAESQGIQVYYQNTDSMHIQQDSVPILAVDFKSKYKLELIGIQLGQFHNNFAGDSEVYTNDLCLPGRKLIQTGFNLRWSHSS